MEWHKSFDCCSGGPGKSIWMNSSQSFQNHFGTFNFREFLKSLSTVRRSKYIYFLLLRKVAYYYIPSVILPLFHAICHIVFRTWPFLPSQVRYIWPHMVHDAGLNCFVQKICLKTSLYGTGHRWYGWNRGFNHVDDHLFVEDSFHFTAPPEN